MYCSKCGFISHALANYRSGQSRGIGAVRNANQGEPRKGENVVKKSRIVDMNAHLKTISVPVNLHLCSIVKGMSVVGIVEGYSVLEDGEVKEEGERVEESEDVGGKLGI